MTTPSLPFESLASTPAEVHRSERGVTYVWRPAPGLFATRVEGVLTAQSTAAMEATVRRVVAADRRVFHVHDWWEMTDYDAESRVRLTAMAREQRAVTDGTHILVRSKLVAFGVQAANLVLRSLTVHTERASLETVLRDALRARGAA